MTESPIARSSEHREDRPALTAAADRGDTSSLRRRPLGAWAGSKSLLLVFVFVALVVPPPPEAGARIYVWTDTSGGTHISDQPPPEGVADEAAVARTPAAAGHFEASSAPESRSTSTGPFTKGLLWKIMPAAGASNGTAPGYLFGTIHLGDPRVLNVPAEMRRAFEDSAAFCMEVIPDLTTTVALATSMLNVDGDNLETLIGKELFEKIAPRMAERGIPREALDLLKPWAVLMTLSVPASAAAGQALDLVLYETAEKAGKPVCALETAEEQIALFEKMPVEDQVHMLREAVKRDDTNERLKERMIESYLARDLSGMLRLSEEENGGDAEARKISEAFMKRALDDRNRRMVERMTAKLKEGNVFIAVGAAHLAGERGILSLLQRQGFTVTRAY